MGPHPPVRVATDELAPPRSVARYFDKTLSDREFRADIEWKEFSSRPIPLRDCKGRHAMFRNRITMQEPEPLHLPHPPGPQPHPWAFVLVAIPCQCQQQMTQQQWLYQQAFEAAQAVVRPSIVARDLLGVWN